MKETETTLILTCIWFENCNNDRIKEQIQRICKLLNSNMASIEIDLILKCMLEENTSNDRLKKQVHKILEIINDEKNQIV